MTRCTTKIMNTKSYWIWLIWISFEYLQWFMPQMDKSFEGSPNKIELSDRQVEAMKEKLMMLKKTSPGTLIHKTIGHENFQWAEINCFWKKIFFWHVVEAPNRILWRIFQRQAAKNRLARHQLIVRRLRLRRRKTVLILNRRRPERPSRRCAKAPAVVQFQISRKKHTRSKAIYFFLFWFYLGVSDDALRDKIRKRCRSNSIFGDCTPSIKKEASTSSKRKSKSG